MEEFDIPKIPPPIVYKAKQTLVRHFFLEHRMLKGEYDRLISMLTCGDQEMSNLAVTIINAKDYGKET